MSPEHKSRMDIAPVGANASDGADYGAILDVLHGWLSRRLRPDAIAWLTGEVSRQSEGVDERRLGIALGLVGRKIGRANLALSVDDIATAGRLRARWRPDLWSADEAARIAIVLATYRGNDIEFAAEVDRLCLTAELTEHVALLKGFAIFPAAKRIGGRAREAVRSSASAISQAITDNNPYPFDHFDETTWNQMVVKCVFNGSSIEAIIGLEERRNPELMRMLRDLVSERHAAGRVLPNSIHRYLKNN
jgi:hypothetical protein